jgi:hypothetical protein
LDTGAGRGCAADNAWHGAGQCGNLIAELGDLSRFGNPRQLMAYLGLVPSENSNGASVKRGGLTKAGNSAVRRLLIEAAWTYRFPARVSRELRLRQEEQPRTIREIAWKAQLQLCARYRKEAAADHPTCRCRARLGARSRPGEPSHPLSAGSPIRRCSLDRGSSATHQRSCGFDPRIRV